MGEEAYQIGKEIEDTRAEMTETVQEISRRADVPERVKSAVQRGSEKWFGRDAGEVQAGAGQRLGGLAQRFRENAMLGLAASFVAGMFAGMLLVIRARSRS